MNTVVRPFPMLALLILILSLTCAAYAAPGLTRVHYPSQDQAQFVVDVPSGWTLIPQGEEGAADYFEVEGPKGLELSFRVVPGADIEKAVQEHIAYLQENFSEITMADSKETRINGMEAILLPAKGTDEDGVLRDFGAGWFQLDQGAVGELWYNVDDSDSAGKAAAVTVLNSLRKP
jgi:hypothetical protein